MYVCVYDGRDSSRQSAPSPSLSYPLTQAQSTLPTTTFLEITFTQVLWFLELLTTPENSSGVTTRTRFTVCLPHATQCIRGVTSLDPPVSELVSHYTDTHLYIFSVVLAVPLVINKVFGSVFSVPVPFSTHCMRGV
jgi:hypothetical protein